MNLTFFWDMLRGFGLLVLIFGGFFAFLHAMLKSAFLTNLTGLLIGLLCGWLAQNMYYQEQMLKSAEIVPATVTDMKKTRKSRSTKLTIYLTYGSPVDGTLQSADANIPTFKAYEEIAIGDIMDLRVSIEDPSITCLEQYYPPNRPLLYTIIILGIFFISTSVMPLFDLSQPKNQVT